MKQKVPKEVFIFRGGVSAWIMIVNAVLLAKHIPFTWTIFFANIFFFMLGADIKKWKEILFGGLFGLATAWIAVTGVHALAPMLGELPAALISCGSVVVFILMLGPVLPVICNDIAFAYFTIAMIDVGTVLQNTVPSMVVFLVGGLVMVGGSYAIFKTIFKNAAPHNEEVAS